MAGRSVLEIVSDLLWQLPALIRQESRLARSEILEAINQISSGMIVVLCGSVLMIPALVVTLLAGVYGLENAGFSPWAASLIAGGAAFIVAFVMLMIGMNRVRAARLIPERTIHQIAEDASVAKRQTREVIHDQSAA
jgi:Putative Actinobacterial Holin-X, holin superfamily III